MNLAALAERRHGGRLHGLFYLLHPGPSVLVTTTLVAVTALALHALPPLSLALRLVALMLPLQFAIGIVNDLADAADDAVTKPYKPLLRGAVSRRTAVVMTALFIAIGLIAAATVSAAVLLLTCAGFSAGLAYDVGLRRSVLSLLPWWVGMLTVPLLGFAAANRLDARLLPALPLSLLLALSLHCANAYPDIGGDRQTGKRGFPAAVGRGPAFGVMVSALFGLVVLALTLFRPHAATIALVATCGLTLLALVAVAALRPARPFPLLAILSGAVTVAWLAGVAYD